MGKRVGGNASRVRICGRVFAEAPCPLPSYCPAPLGSDRLVGVWLPSPQGDQLAEAHKRSQITQFGVPRSPGRGLLSVVLLRGMEHRNRRNQPLPAAAPLAVRRLAEGNHMEANADRLLELLHQFEDFTDGISPERAHSEFDETTLQLFWMQWPQVSSWTGSLWRMLSEELSGPSAPHTDSELDEVGESG